MQHVFRRGKHHDFSFDGVSRQLGEVFDRRYSKPLPESQMQKGQELLELFESKRQQNMLEYSEKKLLDTSGE